MAIKRVRESFSWWDSNNAPHDMPAGTIVDSERTEAYKGREHLFEDVDVYVDRMGEKSAGYAAPKPEQATADPGEKRSVTPKPSPDETRTVPVSRFQPPTTAKKEEEK